MYCEEDNVIYSLYLFETQLKCCFKISIPYFCSLLTFCIDVIVVHKSAPSPKSDMWIRELQLSMSDLNILLNGGELTDSIINASQQLLSEQHPHLVGFQNTILGHLLNFTTTRHDGVQILHTGMHHPLCNV